MPLFANIMRTFCITATAICTTAGKRRMRELARCYMDWSVRRDETREDAQNTILRAQRKLDALAEQFGMGPKLKVVK